MLYNFTHAHICDLRLQVHMEEKLANLPKLIGRPLKMIGLEGAVAGGKKKEMVSKSNPKKVGAGTAMSEAAFVHLF